MDRLVIEHFAPDEKLTLLKFMLAPLVPALMSITVSVARTPPLLIRVHHVAVLVASMLVSSAMAFAAFDAEDAAANAVLPKALVASSTWEPRAVSASEGCVPSYVLTLPLDRGSNAAFNARLREAIAVRGESAISEAYSPFSKRDNYSVA